MNAEHVLAKLRQYLLIISAGIFVMTVTELSFLNQWKQTIQFLPFGLSGLGLLTLALVYFRPNRGTLTTMRWSMFVIAVCSLIGFYEHMLNNYGFWLEVKPNSTTWDLIKATLEGPNPI
jgi:hypothetical protein